MSPAVYRLRRAGSPCVNGVTRPTHGSLGAIIKLDGIEARHCVYNEIAAVRLAELLDVPVATGVLIERSGLAFASLELEVSGARPRPMSARQHAAVAAECPDAAAALLVFDAWIGNLDRAENFIVGRKYSPSRLVGFDHSHALLDASATARESLQVLLSDAPCFDRHPFWSLAGSIYARRSIERVLSLTAPAIKTKCELGRPVGAVSSELQTELAHALVKRAQCLPRLLKLGPATEHSGLPLPLAEHDQPQVRH